MASVFEIINQIKDENAISNCIEESFTGQIGFMNRIDITNAVLKNQKRDIGKQVLYYNLNKYKKKGSFDIFIDISEHVTVV